MPSSPGLVLVWWLLKCRFKALWVLRAFPQPTWEHKYLTGSGSCSLECSIKLLWLAQALLKIGMNKLQEDRTSIRLLIARCADEVFLSRVSYFVLV